RMAGTLPALRRNQRVPKLALAESEGKRESERARQSDENLLGLGFKGQTRSASEAKAPALDKESQKLAKVGGDAQVRLEDQDARGGKPAGAARALAAEPFDRKADLGRPLQQVEAAADQAPAAEVFAPIVDNPFVSVAQDPQSTFSIDVDTASY